jgi:hypothetical protein
MSQATLLNSADPMFTFEHMMQHRQYFPFLPDLSHFSALPYLLDPAQQQDIPAGPWHQKHQQAHDDFNASLPPFYNYNPADAPSLPFRIMQTNILVEGDKSSRESWTWWTFTNHQEHFIANDAVLPLPLDGPGAPPWWKPPIQYPFW